MIRLRSHPAYKPSGIEWVGDIPAHWDVKPLFALMREVKNLNRGMVEQNLLSLSYGNIVRKDIDQSEGLLPESFETYNIIEQGDIVLRLTDLQNDKRSLRSAIAHETGIITSAYLTLRALVAAEYCSHLFRAYDVMKVFYSMGGGLRQSLRFEDVRRIPLLVPPATEAAKVTRYIDRETARIDTLIKKKTRFIELLKEKRQALITHAVTKGLNPEAPMKDSGIEWLGQVPAHWTTGNIRRFAIMKTGHTPSRSQPEYWVKCTIPWFTLADVWQLREGRQKFLGTTKERISQLGLENSAADLLPAGTVVFSRTASVGFSGIMPHPMATSQDFWNWIPDNRLLPDYLLYLFRAMQQEFAKLTMGSTHKTVYQADAAGLAMCLPPMEEQRAIVGHVESQLHRIDLLVDKTQQSIDLLKERRITLVTAAVTGKIDLREAA